MIAPGPSSRAPRSLTWAETSPFAVPGVTVKVRPSTRMLPLLAMVRAASWASANVETRDVSATEVATRSADLHLEPVIGISCMCEVNVGILQGLASRVAAVLSKVALSGHFLPQTLAPDSTMEPPQVRSSQAVRFESKVENAI